MKKLTSILSTILVVLFALPMLNSCKTGENDPSISLKSREARLMQAWKLVKVEGSRQYVNWSGDVVIETYSYDGTIYTVSGGGSSQSATGTYEAEYLDKGIVQIKETLTSNGNTDVYSGTGTWMWMNSDKDKNYIWTDGANLFSGNMYYIDRLSSKEIVFKQSYNENDNGDISKGEFTYTFERK